MGKKMKLKLNDLEIQSFVTSMEAESAEVIKGGASVHGPLCSNQICETDACHGTRTCDDGGTNTCTYSAPIGCTYQVCNPSQFPCGTGGVQCPD